VSFTEIIQHLFLYKEGEPILFTKIYFWGFFAVVLLIYSLIYKQNTVRTIFLLVVSFFFYYKTSGLFLSLLIFTICSDYLWGELIFRSTTVWKKKLFVTISLVLNLFFLCFFKYAWFFTNSYNEIMHTKHTAINIFSQFANENLGTHFNIGMLIVPAGVSFFTFQSISYIVDLYRGKIEPVRTIFDYGFFVCFFPHLVAGPIVKAKEFIFQIYQPYNLSRTEFGMAAFWIINGFGKKILGDYVAVNFIDRVFANTQLYSGVECILSIFAYSFQVYADFSGYTDIAIGVALLMGFRLKTNFLSPYKAASTSEFWQRWHISLSSWLKDYLYIPLGGNREGTAGSYIVIAIMCGIVCLLSGALWLPVLITFIIVAIIFILLGYFFQGFRRSINTNINLMITMLLGGFWHGSSWMFITWGGLNGLGLVAHKFWEKINPFSRISEKWFYRAIMIFVTLTFISFTRIWFRVGSMKGGSWENVKTFFDRMAYHMGGDLFFNIVWGYRNVMLVMLIGYLIHWIPENFKERYRMRFATMPLPAMGVCIVVIVFFLYQMMGLMQPFIYFQF
jgi:alginate O-acetyltransferase complex protein AlgI